MVKVSLTAIDKRRECYPNVYINCIKLQNNQANNKYCI